MRNLKDPRARAALEAAAKAVGGGAKPARAAGHGVGVAIGLSLFAVTIVINGLARLLIRRPAREAA